jgi:multiple sugar transport system substrate-binding protein
MLSSGERLDVISTHSKYAPSQAPWLLALDRLIDPGLIGRLAPSAVSLCRFRGELLCVPRGIDVRVLWYRRDVLDEAPRTWDEVEACGRPFGFPGRESGLFGTFFELVVGAGGVLFCPEGEPAMDTPECVAAVERLCRLARGAPADLPSWHYDQVDAALLAGQVDLAAAWPGGYGPIRESTLYDRLSPAPYPAGTRARVSYAGCHAWGIPSTAADPAASAALIAKLCSQRASATDAARGTVCADVSVFAALEPVDSIDARRLEITRQTIESAMITYPPLACFPEIEDAGWSAIHDSLIGSASAAETVARIQAVAEEVLGHG